MNHTHIGTMAWSAAALLFAGHCCLASGAENLSLKTGIGVAIQSDTQKAGVAEFSSGRGAWAFNIAYFGISQSETTIHSVLSGITYGTTLNTSKSLTLAGGLGVFHTQTLVGNSTASMTNVAYPISLEWTPVQWKSFEAGARFTSWLFFPSYIPILELLAHEEIVTASVFLGVAL